MKNKYEYKPVDEYAGAGLDWMQILYDPDEPDLVKSVDGNVHPLNSL